MSQVTIYGASDDLIEVEGDIREEFSWPKDDGAYLGISDGTVLSIVFGQMGIWRIAPIVRGSAELVISQAPADDEDDYTDRAILTGDIRWVVCGDQLIR